jgi:A1 cistron-splicing factor AAR2
MDTSSHIKAIISGVCTYEDSDEIIGEIQFCYLTGMLIGNAACMEHWVRLICTSNIKPLFTPFSAT